MQTIKSTRLEQILLVEDDLDQATVLKSYLGHRGYKLDWGSSPEEAWQNLQARPYSLILLDIMFAKREVGFEFCRRVKEDAKLRSIPVIMVTARSAIQDRVLGLRSGADDYVIKPFSQEELLARVEAVLARKELLEFNEKYRALLENSDEIVLFLDIHGTVESYNQMALVQLPELQKYTRGFNLVDLFHEHLEESIRGLFERVASGFDVSGNSWRLKKSHDKMEVVDTRLVPLFKAGHYVGMGCILRDATHREKALQSMQAHTAALRQEVEHTSARLNEVQEKLIMSEKMAAMGQLAAGIAHELRNPLNTISTSVYYLKRILPQDQIKANEHFTMIEQEIQRAKSIIGNLLDFSRKSPEGRVELNINALLHQMLALVQQELTIYNIQLETDFKAEHTCYINPDEMKQAFLNFILNAREAMPYGGVLSVRTRSDSDTSVVVEFGDTGIGIPEAMQDKIFDPFFTTRKDGRGVGLGLSIAHSAIERNSGSVRFHSQPNKGTIFFISLPTLHK